MNRRQFVGALAAAGAMPYLSPLAMAIKPRPDEAAIRRLYENSIIIDATGFPSSPVAIDDVGEQQLADARASGIAAINITVSTPEFDKTVKNVAFWLNQAMIRPETFSIVRRGEDIALAKERNTLGLILGFQHMSMIGNDLALIETFHQLGVRVMQLTYNLRNLLGNGCLEPGDGGLSRLGRDAVEKMNELRIAVDVSHCGTQTSADAIEMSSQPVLITHSGARAVYEHPRNKHDRELRAMADKGGVVGIYFMPFLGDDGTPYANLDMLLDHLDHLLNVCGTEHVGIGTDNTVGPIVETEEFLASMKVAEERRRKSGVQAPGEAGKIPYMPDLNTPRRIEDLAIAMSKRGYPMSVIEKVLGLNFQRAFTEIWG